MKKSFIIFILVIALSFGSITELFSSPDISGAGWSHHSVFFEIAGAGVLYSLNYEYFMKSNIGIRLGAGLAIFGYSYPFAINYYIGSEKRLELGAGLTYYKGNFIEDFTNNFLLTTIGYRFQRQKGGFIFRATLHPIYIIENERFSFLVGLSFGYGF